MTNTCPTTPFTAKESPFTAKESPFTAKESPFTALELCAHLNQENGYAILSEDSNLIFI
jgi:hypothetical protein